MVKIVHIITGLSTGGAETMLYNLLSQCNRQLYEPMVISLTDIGPLGKKISTLNIPISALGMRRGVPSPVAFIRLVAMLRCERPDIIQTWMYHADLMGAMAAKIAGGMPVVWGIHHTNLVPKMSKKLTLLTARTNAILSHRMPHRIICCSGATLRTHADLGYNISKMVAISNGFNVAAYRPTEVDRSSVRRELGIPDGDLIIGLIGRFDPQKDHQTFIRAAGILYGKHPQTHFVLCGDGITWSNVALVKWIAEAGIKEHCHLLGCRNDIPRVLTAFDILALSSSFGEGFPMVIGEAMSCGVPCVVTDVGESALIVGDTGRVVVPGKPEAMANALEELIAMSVEGRSNLGAMARQRIIDNFSLNAVVKQYEHLYEEVCLS